ncbi:glutamine--fructose-6-phosphate transaminase (isomerizing) [Candidatus Kapabacteria bacterium]|nr:glutamine--fructose-6-phosphate transaminase (isomerizing) [Candidatus Kapabacteria bacterium]
MCGIVGYIGKRKASEILINGLKRLEYRGYDSSGVALYENDKINILKQQGKVNQLDRMIPHDMVKSNIGIAHTRWATHGFPNYENAHPHTDNSKEIAIVHNGIIENYSAIKKKLLQDGYTFESDTDTEVLAVFIGALYKKTKNLEQAVRLALNEVDGTYGIAVVSSYEPDKIIAARLGSPMILGIGEDEYILASDAAAIIAHTKQVIYLEDKEMVVVRGDGYSTKTIDNLATTGDIKEIDFDIEQIEKSGYEHFMLKEIFEQPDSIRNSLRGRLIIDKGNVRLGGLNSVRDKLLRAKRIILTACGTSWHAALTAEYLIEQLAHIPVEVEYASEFRYRNPIIGPDDIVFALSQSGETLDTLAAIKEAQLKGATTLGIVNVVGSTIARETEAGIYLHAGPEIGVASTKAYTSQLTVMALIALYLGRQRYLSQLDGKRIGSEMMALPDKITSILAQTDKIKEIADQYYQVTNCLYLGRGVNFPLALEGALKLKEISYIHAEGYPAAEMKHGPIALIDENMPIIFIATQDEIYDKVLSNIEEVRTRRGKVIAIANEGDTRIASLANHVIYIPNTLPMLNPILAVVPLQLLSYYIAIKLGRDVDQPRNLAKSVTVE